MKTSHARSVLAAMAIVFAAGSLPAAASPLELGVHGGLSLASYFWQEGSDWNQFSLMVYHPDASVYLALSLSPTVAVQVEAGYAGRGASIEAGSEYMRWYFDYLEVPVILMFSETSSSTRVYGGLGGYVATMLHGSRDFDSASENLSGKAELVIDGATGEDHAAKLDYGVVVAAGIGGTQFFTELRFYVGVTPVLDFTLIDGVHRQALNADIQLLVGWHL
jgi:hypothetical protein